MDRYLILITHKTLSKANLQQFEKLFAAKKLKSLIVKRQKNGLLIKVPLFDYIEFDLLGASYINKLRITLLKKNFKTDKYAIEIKDAKINSDEWQEILRKVRL